MCAVASSKKTQLLWSPAAQKKCHPPHKVCQRCTEGYVPGEDGSNYLIADFQYKCHLCAGMPCPARVDLHRNDGVDEVVVKFFVFESGSKVARYQAVNLPAVTDPMEVIRGYPYDDHFRVKLS